MLSLSLNLRWLTFGFTIAAQILISPGLALAQSPLEELGSRLIVWKQAAPVCPVLGVSFATKQLSDPKQPTQICDDGDMTLFNGLLCSAGVEIGCLGVAEARESATGKWHRSPRIRVLGKNDRGNADFSPDMALGVTLYAIKKGAAAEVYQWLSWISENTPCAIKGLHPCPETLKLEPRFCELAECVIRPQDYQVLALLVTYLQLKHSMQELPNGRLRGLIGSFNGHAELAKTVAALINDPGFPQHLVGTSVLIYMLKDLATTSLEIQAAAKILQTRNTGNAFFTFLAEGKSDLAVRETLDRCPSDPSKLQAPLMQWQWERANQEQAWTQSMLWDCIFMARLLSK
jgi:hypothetical protein